MEGGEKIVGEEQINKKILLRVKCYLQNAIFLENYFRLVFKESLSGEAMLTWTFIGRIVQKRSDVFQTHSERNTEIIFASTTLAANEQYSGDLNSRL